MKGSQHFERTGWLAVVKDFYCFPVEIHAFASAVEQAVYNLVRDFTTHNHSVQDDVRSKLSRAAD